MEGSNTGFQKGICFCRTWSVKGPAANTTSLAITVCSVPVKVSRTVTLWDELCESIPTSEKLDYRSNASIGAKKKSEQLLKPKRPKPTLQPAELPPRSKATSKVVSVVAKDL